MNTKSILKTYITQDILNSPTLELDDEEMLVGGDLISSLGIVQLISFIEEKFSISIPFEDVTIENFRDLNTIANYIGTLQSY